MHSKCAIEQERIPGCDTICIAAKSYQWDGLVWQKREKGRSFLVYVQREAMGHPSQMPESKPIASL